MRPLDVAFRPAAIADLRGILLSIFEVGQSPVMARGYVRRLQGRCQKIGDAPGTGMPRDDLAPGLRIVTFERAAVIAYTIDGNRVSITNVFFGGGDFEALCRGAEIPADPTDEL